MPESYNWDLIIAQYTFYYIIMKSNHPLTPKKGFTLIELLTVIAIIGILAGIIIPTVGRVRDSAGKTKASNNLRQIANAYALYALSGQRVLNISNDSNDPNRGEATDIANWAGVLAIKSDLYDARVYYVDNDDDAPNVIPPTVGTWDGTTYSPNANFTDQSVVVVANMSRRAGTTLPVVWTRGLDTADGTWDTNSPWGTEGGVLAMTDGSVQFYSDLLGDSGDGVLLDFDDRSTTFSVSDALNDDAVFFGADGVVN